MSYRIECDTLDELRALIGGAQEVPHQAEASPPTDPRLAALARNMGITPEELARATGKRPMTDIASLAEPFPVFAEDPMADDAPLPKPGVPSSTLTDKARAEFAAATAVEIPKD